MTDQEIFQKLKELKDKGVPFSLATIVKTTGSTPRDVGAKMMVSADGSLYGTVGGGCGENQVRSAAMRCAVTNGKPEVVQVDLTDDIGTKGGAVCGGKMWVFVEPIR